MRTAALVALVGIIVGGKLVGLYVIGNVATGSMEPALPRDSLFFAVRGDAHVGDVVVFQVPSGERVVHRVVGVQSDGALVTKGDANALDDVATGIGPVDPRTVLLVPQTAGTPWHVKGAMASPVVVGVVQVGLVGLAVAGLLAERVRGGRQAVRPSTLMLAAAAAFMVASPLFQDTAEVHDHVGVRASVFPVVARVWNETSDQVVHVDAMAEKAVEAQGIVHVATVPAAPGAAALVRHGAVMGALPSAGLLCAVAALMRAEGH